MKKKKSDLTKETIHFRIREPKFSTYSKDQFSD